MLTASGSGVGVMLAEVSRSVAVPKSGKRVSFRRGVEENRRMMRSRYWMMRSRSRCASGKKPRQLACAVGGTVEETLSCIGVTESGDTIQCFTSEDGSLLVIRLGRYRNGGLRANAEEGKRKERGRGT